MKNRSIYFALLLASVTHFEPSLAMHFPSQNVAELRESTPDRNLIWRLLEALENRTVAEGNIETIATTYNNLPESN